MLTSANFAPLLPSCDSDALRGLVSSRLHQLGVAATSKRSSSAMRKRTSALPSSATPAAMTRTPGKSMLGGQRVFRRPLRDLSMIMVSLGGDSSDGSDLMVPKFLVSLCEWLRIPERLSVEGLFRRSGSSARQRILRESMEASENWPQTLTEASVLDVASLLKQWLRELPEPLVPAHLQKLLLESWLLEDAAARSEAVLLCCCLLPVNHACTLVYLVRFFSEVAQFSSKNKMDLVNLAIVLTPTFFPMEECPSALIAAKKNSGPAGGEMLAQKTEIVEYLFLQAQKVGYLPHYVSEAYLDALSLPSHSEDNLDDEGVSGPSARRRKKKKRRSGSLSRVLTATMKGIQKAMSRSATPVAPKRPEGDYVHCTPLPKADSGFTSPRLPAKRKALVEHDLSPGTKQLRKLESSFTPKVRGRSFSVKKFKRKKSLKGGDALASFHAYSNFSPLPSKPAVQLTLMTPKTPGFLDLPHQGCDIFSPEEPSSFRDVSIRTNNDSEVEKSCLDNSSFGSSRTSSTTSQKTTKSTCTLFDSSPTSVTKRDPERRRRSRSPSERKISIVRRRSQDMARKIAEAAAPPALGNPNKLDEKSNLTPCVQLHNMRAQLKKGHGPSPSRAAHPLRAVTAVAHESLTNLREDINSFIEKSFGPADESGSRDETDGFAVDKTLDALCSNSLRRQSSAFEFSRAIFPPGNEMRRQSSAFEIAARNREQYHVYENFNPCATRASLRRKNSSVKDLVKKLEASKLLEKKTNEKEQNENKEEMWTDATEFFKNPIAIRQLIAEDSSGCKRSSIIKIRKEKKGIVSKSVETFMKPTLMLPPPRQSVQQPTSSNRRLSARMGVSTRTHVATPSNSQESIAVATYQARRQTLTGIRTSVSHKQHSSEKTQVSSSHSNQPSQNKSTLVNVYHNPALVQTPDPIRRPDRKSKRMETRRHLTIGYLGEVRSPLMERQNIVATVQRSKSAQTPLQSKPHRKAQVTIENENSPHPMVRRSYSLRSPIQEIDIPGDLKETIYSVTTPKSVKLRRHQSDRIGTPKKKPQMKQPMATPKSLKVNFSAAKQDTPCRPVKPAAIVCFPNARKSPRMTRMY